MITCLLRLHVKCKFLFSLFVLISHFCKQHFQFVITSSNLLVSPKLQMMVHIPQSWDVYLPSFGAFTSKHAHTHYPFKFFCCFSKKVFLDIWGNVWGLSQLIKTSKRLLKVFRSGPSAVVVSISKVNSSIFSGWTRPLDLLFHPSFFFLFLRGFSLGKLIESFTSNGN